VQPEFLKHAGHEGSFAKTPQLQKRLERADCFDYWWPDFGKDPKSADALYFR
jgi:hypothetical protein